MSLFKTLESKGSHKDAMGSVIKCQCPRCSHRFLTVTTDPDNLDHWTECPECGKSTYEHEFYSATMAYLFEGEEHINVLEVF